MSIVFYSFLAALATIIGGGLPLLYNNISQRQLSLLIAFSAGLLLSAGLNHMAIESIAISGRWAMVALSFGFVFIYGYEKMAMTHACREKGCKTHSFGYPALIGIGFHSFLDGFVIAISFEFEKTLGFMVIMAVILHRLPTGISLTAILLSHGYKESKAWVILIIVSLLAIIGGIVGVVIELSNTFILSLAIAFSGGLFIYISTTNLIPIAHKNNQDYRVPIFFLIGFFSIMAISFIE
jgi:zinc and cadmium transporter